VRSPVCSTDAIRHAGQRAIGGQSVRLSANSLRPERRSTDGSGGREGSHLPAPTDPYV